MLYKDIHSDQPSSQSVALPRGDTLGAPIRVMLVDDDPLVMMVLRARLTVAGYSVTCFESGEAAIEHLETETADMAILDVQMPGMSGLHLLEHMLDLLPELMVILSTAHSSEEILLDALRRGAMDYLRKPVPERDLRAMLGRVVRTLTLKRENALLHRELEEKRLRLEKEIARASQVQADLLPHEVPPLPGYDLAARCVPARDVGGDFYDWQMPKEGLFNLVFGDVMGKGMPAALLMTTVRAVIRSTIRAVSPEINMFYASGVLEPDLDRAGSFVTLFHAQLDICTGEVRYVDCGHGCAFVVRANGDVVEDLEPRGVPIGLPRSEPFAYGSVMLAAGDALVIYSDGLLDARPDLLADGNRAVASLIAGCSGSAAIVERLIEIAQLEGPQPDDLTVLVLVRR